MLALAVLAKRMKGRKTMPDVMLSPGFELKLEQAAEKLGAHTTKPKKRRHKKSTRKSAKRVRAAKKAARTRKANHAKRSRAAKKGARRRARR
jgi:hypothetical protein